MEVYQLIADLILKQLKGELNPDETGELNRWANESDSNQELFQQLTSQETLNAEVMSFYESQNRIWQKIQNAIPEAKVVRMENGFSWKRWTLAASIILTLGVGSYFLFFNKTGKKNEIVKTTVPNDVKAPETNRAMITLADGRQIFIDSTGNGRLATAGTVTVTKNSNGEIVYNGTATVVEYNTLFNPRGSKVQPLTLSDGTKVWLNSESSIMYPTAFTGNERKVEISGEAYFEVTQEAKKKFIVESNGVKTEVLGTHFNVNTYSDEASIKVTLLEGSIKVSNGNGSGFLKPGQQAQVASEVKVVNNVDLEQVMSWKNGSFSYKGADIHTIMREVGRWYDVEIVFENEINEKFYADVSRNTNVSTLFKMLETTKAVHFKIEGNKVVVRK